MEKRMIKYRAKRKDSDVWVYGHPFTKLEDEFSTFQHLHACDKTGYWGMVLIQPETLSAYSGFADYYEGDRLSLLDDQEKQWTGTVVFKEGMFALELEKETHLPLIWALKSCCQVTVIGTIWDEVKEGGH